MAGAGRTGLGHAPAALQLHVGLALENPGNLDRQRRAARSATDQRRQVAAFQIRKTRDRDPHGRHAGKRGRPLDLDVAHHGLDVEALVQRDQVAALKASQQDHRQRVDMKQRQHADHALDGIAFGPRILAPDIIDRHRGSQIAMAEHGALRQSGGAAGILQQGNVVGRYRWPLHRPGCALHECLEGHDRRMIRDRRMRIADRAPIVVLADDQPIEQALVEEFQRRRQQCREIAGDENARAAVA